jgi:hypothetical protein
VSAHQFHGPEVPEWLISGCDDPVDVTRTIFELAGGKVPGFGGGKGGEK